MATIKYKTDDALPIALLVLMKASQLLKAIILKFVLKDHYPDLRGLVSIEEPSKSSDQLIDEFEDPFINMLVFMLGALQVPMININNVYGIDPPTVVFNQSAWQTADELLYELIICDFILLDERQQEDNYDDDEYLENLDMFIYTLITVLNQLLIVLNDGVVDIEEAISCYGLIIDFDNKCYSETTHVYAMGALCDLGSILLEYQDKIRNQDYSMG